ncbi:MAG: PIG-L family deacetylase, partial [Acidobacteria bacterium]|nr:PIG-L family deacetylase [Acidobacteriota bacterium]
MKRTNRKGLTVTRRDFISQVTSVGAVMGASSQFASRGYGRAAQPQQTASSRSATRAPSRILVVVAHADDMEYNIGGSVAKWVAEGHEVFRAAVTDSARGSFEAGMTVEKLAKIGVDEAEAAAKVLGLKGNFFLGFPDGMTKLADEAAVREKLMRLIRRRKANVVVT